ncbi:MAG: hypothetical protein ACYC6Y_02775 [Thermoguttaceae bacterium]
MTKTATVHAQQRWEYMSLSRKTEAYLAQELVGLGQEGWELVTVNYARGKKEEMFWTAFLKRPSSGHAVPATPQAAAPARHDLAPAGGAETAGGMRGFEAEGDTFEIHEEKKPVPEG